MDSVEISQSLLDAIDRLPFFTNRSKLQRLVKAEQAFLERADASEAQKVTSNLPYLNNIVRMCEAVNACTVLHLDAVLKRFTAEEVAAPVTVEVVATFPSGGRSWIKCFGQSSDYSRVRDLADCCLKLSALSLEGSHLRPRVCFRFFGGLPEDLRKELAEQGVDVADGAVPPKEDLQSYNSVNMDITALIALTSNLSHGEVGWSFEDGALQQQALQEAEEPVLQELHQMLEGKRLVVSSTALQTYHRLVRQMGGEEELARAERIAAALTVVDAVPPEGLRTSKKVSQAVLEIVAVGYQHDMPTCTSNGKAMRSIEEAKKGIRFLPHMPRALSEGKEGLRASRTSQKHMLSREQLEHLFVSILSGPTGPDQALNLEVAATADVADAADAAAPQHRSNGANVQGDPQTGEACQTVSEDEQMEQIEVKLEAKSQHEANNLHHEANNTGGAAASSEADPNLKESAGAAAKAKDTKSKLQRKKERKKLKRTLAEGVEEALPKKKPRTGALAERLREKDARDFTPLVDFWPLFGDLVADTAFSDMCTSCLAALLEVCRDALSTPEFVMHPFDWYPQPKLTPFGSYVQGTALKTSDLDVRLSVQFDVRQKESQLKYLNAVAAFPSEHFRMECMIATAQVPVLRLRFRDHLQVDITMGDADECLAVDHAVSKMLASTGPNARSLVCLVKAFAKSKGLVDAYAGFLNSVGWVFLCISFLQVEGCLPGIDQDEDLDDLLPVCLDIGTLYRLMGFVTSCCQTRCRISLRRCDGFGPVPLENKSATLLLEHPSVPNRNLARSFRDPGPERTAAACHEAQRQLLRSQEALQDVFCKGSRMQQAAQEVKWASAQLCV